MAVRQPVHILYHHPYSICSIMVRYAFALRGRPKGEEIRIQEEQIDILNGGQLTEHYLCDINRAGEVPVLVPEKSAPIPDSQAITKYLAESYPALIPTSHAAEIEQSLSELHKISFFGLTFAGRPQTQEAAKAFLQSQLDGNTISDRYREAIRFKVSRINNLKLGALTQEKQRSNEEYTRQQVQKYESLIKGSKTGWLFGLDRPSALDAHLTVFIARLQDKKRNDLIPETLKTYASKAMAGPEWQEVMQGRNTLPQMPAMAKA